MLKLNSLIPQQYSWGKLVISYEAICMLLTHLKVFPAIIDMLRAFGEKIGHADESYSEFSFQENEESFGEQILILSVFYLTVHEKPYT